MELKRVPFFNTNDFAKSFSLRVAMLVQVSDKYLMVVNENDTRYKHPGGHVNSEESLTDAIIREVMEETGIDLKNDDLIPFKYDLVNIDGNLMINGYTKIQISEEIAENVLANSPLKSRLFKLEELNEDNTYNSEIEVIHFFLSNE
jgi:8-oxo-dGTP pyrophosphatase MutT (NUDIX family)